MLKEIRQCRQIPGERSRRWFTDADTDLIVWFEPDASIYGFQLCYGKKLAEHALTWTIDRGFTHRRVDTGEALGYATDAFTPVLVPDGVFPRDTVLPQFLAVADQLDPTIKAFILTTIKQLPA